MSFTMFGNRKTRTTELKVGDLALEHQRWIERICRDGRDKEAETAIYDKFQPGLVRIACSIVGEANAEDVVQVVFAKLLNGPKLRPFMDQSETALRAWLIHCTKNECYDFLRRPANRKRLSLSEREAGVISPEQTYNDDPYEEHRNVFKDCRRELTPRQDEIIQLILDGTDSEDIACLMKITINSVYKLRNAAMKALRLCTEGKLL